jgi:MIP family channel proteins
MEAALLGLFMISAGAVTILLEHPASPLHLAFASPFLRRALAGLAMGLTAIALIYSPWGRQSGAHFNPAVTLTFYRLKRIAGWDAVFYVAAQFLGGTLAIILFAFAGGDLLRTVHYAATLPGSMGPGAAFAAEFFISGLLMSVVLASNDHRGLRKYTGLLCGTLVALFITFESPYSGMSMNPARSFSSAAPAGIWSHLWIYFVAPVLGMFSAVELRRMFVDLEDRACAKIHHARDKRCIFCGHRVAAVSIAILALLFSSVAYAEPVSAGPIALTVSDLQRSISFYRDVLDFREVSRTEAQSPSFDQLTALHAANVKVATMSLGTEQIQLIQFLSPAGHPYPPASASNDLWFQHIAIVVSDMNKAYGVLQRKHVSHISASPQTLPASNKAAAGIKAFYFRDPDQHPLELIYFPPGKGDSKWQHSSDAVFLGIDHTAIAVENTERSAKFYSDVLGFHVAGRSLNYGTEQERLNRVNGSRVRITALRLSSGPGIELLQYETPANGRPIPPCTGVNDIIHAHATVLVDAEQDLRNIWNGGRVRHISRSPARTAPLAPELSVGVIIQDPDGHEVLVRTQ